MPCSGRTHLTELTRDRGHFPADVYVLTFTEHLCENPYMFTVKVPTPTAVPGLTAAAILPLLSPVSVCAGDSASHTEGVGTDGVCGGEHRLSPRVPKACGSPVLGRWEQGLRVRCSVLRVAARMRKSCT